MTGALRIGVFVFSAAIVQVSLVSSLDVAGGTADVLLVALVAVALLRGSVAGAAAGFGGGLVVDVANLGTLGVTSLLLTLAGFWAGRYGETTGRDRAHAPILAVAVISVLVGVVGYALHFMLGEDVAARHALVVTLAPGVVLNLVVAWPVFAIARRLLRSQGPPRGREVEVAV